MIFEKRHIILLWVLFALLTSTNNFSQPLNSDQKKIRTIGTKNFLVHKVEKGQSLYAISKKYNVELKLLIDENPGSIDGIKQGQDLLIPIIDKQQNNNQTTTNITDTAGYITHKLMPNENISGVSRKYNLTENELKTLNPFISNGIKEGQILKIKKRTSLIITEENNTPFTTTSDSDFVWYTSLKKDSLIHVARKFKISESKIQRLNKWSYREFQKNKILSPGQKIRLHQKNIKKQSISLVGQREDKIGNSVKISDNQDTVLRAKKKTYNIGLFLPLRTSESEFTSMEDLVQNKKNFPGVSSLVSDFYLGFKTALDSISSGDFQINTLIFDANESDSAKVLEITKSESFKSLDLIFGPWFSSTFPIVASAASEIGIPCVSPTLQQNKILFKNKSTFKMLPSRNYTLECMAEYIVNTYYSKSSIYLINTDKPKDQNTISFFKDYYNEFLRFKFGIKDTLHELKGPSGGAPGKNGTVVYILLTDNIPFITDFFTQLGRSTRDNKGISLFGYYSWMNLDNLDQGYYGRFNFHCVNPSYVNRQDTQVASLWEKYRNVMFSDPDKIYFEAFDLSAYFLSMLKKFGPDFCNQLSDSPYQGAVIDFNFFSPDLETGFENRSAKILEVQGNKLIPVSSTKDNIPNKH